MIDERSTQAPSTAASPPGGTLFEDQTLQRDPADSAGLAAENARLYEAERAARALAEAAARRANSLLAITTALGSAVTVEEVADVVIEQGLAGLSADAGTVAVLTDGGAGTELVRTIGYPPEMVEALRRTALTVTTPMNEAVRTGAPVWREAGSPDAERFADYAQANRGFASGAGLPLRVGGRTLGAIGVSFREARTFTPEERTFMLAVAAQCAQAVERARLYDAERAARAEAEAAVRARDEFLSIAAHELRTPVTGLRGSAQMLLRVYERGLLDRARLERALHHIDDASARLAALTDDLLDVSRLRTGQLTLRPRPTDLARLVEQAVARWRPQLGAAVQVVTACESCIVAGDPERLNQVIANLLTNAAKYSRGRGDVQVQVTRADGGALLSVRDEGIGLPPGTAETIFQPFGRAPNAARRHIQGMGLGLHICRQIVERHRGRIWAESPGEDQGTTVCVWLPLATPAVSKDLPRQG